MRFVAVRFLAVLILVGAASASAPVGAQSPSPAPSPSASPFPYPTVPPASDVPHGPKLVPIGKPDASVTDHGIRLELWQSSPTVAPGEWIRFAVRTTNLGRDSAWQMSGECLTSGTEMIADLRGVTPAGVTWSGNAAAFKERVMKHHQTEQFPPWRSLDQLWSTATAWAECGYGPGPLELRQGQSRVEHFAWYAGRRLDDSDIWTPPYAGTVPVSVAWPFLARGARPRVGDHGRARTDPIRLQVPLTITGDGPGIPSLDELVDIALADPAWRAWVESDPSRDAWSRYYVRAHHWAGPSYPGSFRNTLDHSNGIIELTLYQRLLRGADHVPAWILLDPWTGEVVHVQVPAPLPDPTASTPPSPLPLASPTIGADPPLREPVRPNGTTARLNLDRKPSARLRRAGLTLEMWLPNGTLRPGDRLKARLRLTNHRSETIDLGCPPASVSALTWRLMDPGRQWNGVAGRFKSRILDDRWFGALPFGSPHAGLRCAGSVGTIVKLGSGRSMAWSTSVLPRSSVRDQPLPGGRLPIRVVLMGPTSDVRRIHASTEAHVRIAGPDWPWASPAEAVDAALSDPCFAAWLSRRGNGPRDGVTESHTLAAHGAVRLGWSNEWLRHGFDGPAPDGTVVWRIHGRTMGSILVDPWTATVLGVSVEAGESPIPSFDATHVDPSPPPHEPPAVILDWWRADGHVASSGRDPEASGS